MRPLKAFAATLIPFLVASLVSTPLAAAQGVSCTETNTPVSLTLIPQTVRGKLCLPSGPAPDTVQLLVHGGAYSKHYWDLPYDNGRYSYQRDMAQRGMATFAVDLLGSGASSQPLSALLTGTAQASVVHQIVRKLRRDFDKVVLVGHSMGSAIAIVEAATYHDVDGVILTGVSHSVDLLMLTRLFVESVRPAALDPVLSARGSDPGYVTTMPGTRNLFHDPGVYEPGMLQVDEATKDQVPATVVPDLLTLALVGPMSLGINVPVLIANGDRDSLFCTFHCSSESALRNAEAPYFRSAAELEVYLLPGAGHSLALDAGAPAFRAAVDDWMQARFVE